MQRMHSSAGMPVRQIKIYTVVRLRHERGMSVSICARKIIDTSFPGGITDHLSSRTHTPHVLKHFAFEWLHRCRRLTRLTSELGEEASRNAHYSKCLCTGGREAPLWRQDTWPELTGKLHIYPAKLPSTYPPSRRVGFLPPAPGFRLWLDCMFWYQRACLGRRRRW